MDERLNKILEFLKETEKFKTIERTVYISDLKRRENDAEHTWHLIMMLYLLEKELGKFDLLKAVKIALVHDLPEIYAGDSPLFKPIKGKERGEDRAARELFSKLPEDFKEEFHNLLKEYREMKTKEAKIVKSLDKIAPIIQNICSEGKDWKDNKVTLEKMDSYKKKFMKHNETINKIYEVLKKESKDKGLFVK